MRESKDRARGELPFPTTLDVWGIRVPRRVGRSDPFFSLFPVVEGVRALRLVGIHDESSCFGFFSGIGAKIPTLGRFSGIWVEMARLMGVLPPGKRVDP